MQNAIKYLQRNFLGILIAIGVITFAVELLFLHDEMNITLYIFIAIAMYANHLKIRAQSVNDADLAKRGLSQTDINNIKFVKKWETIRANGVLKYTLYDGGLIAGMLLVLPLSILKFRYGSKNQFAEFDGMIQFLVECILCGYILGTIIYLMRWRYNENRFIRLTDPLKRN